MKYKWGAILGVWGSAAEGDVIHLNHCNKMRSQDVDSESSLFGRHSAGGCSVCLSQDDQRSSAWWISSSWAGTVRCPQNGLQLRLWGLHRWSAAVNRSTAQTCVTTNQIMWWWTPRTPAVTSAVWTNETWQFLIMKHGHGRTDAFGYAISHLDWLLFVLFAFLCGLAA